MLRSNLIALALCAIAAGLEGIAAGSGVKQRFSTLVLPRWAPRLEVWIAVGVAYYVVCFMVLRRLLALPASGSRTAALILMTVVMVVNAYWNRLFFQRRDLWRSFVTSAVYSLIALTLWLLLWRIDATAMLWLTPYVLYLPYANAFGYVVWKDNRG